MKDTKVSISTPNTINYAPYCHQRRRTFYNKSEGVVFKLSPLKIIDAPFYVRQCDTVHYGNHATAWDGCIVLIMKKSQYVCQSPDFTLETAWQSIDCCWSVASVRWLKTLRSQLNPFSLTHCFPEGYHCESIYFRSQRQGSNIFNHAIWRLSTYV